MSSTVPVKRLEKLWRRFRRKRAWAVRDTNAARRVGALAFEHTCQQLAFAWEAAAADLRAVIDEAKEADPDA